MMTIKKFEELECWQESRSLSRNVYRHAKNQPFSKDFRLSGQITGAVVSVMSNISEGFDSLSNKEFVRFLTYSRRSCSEVQSCLYVALDQRYIEEQDFQVSYEQCRTVRKMIDGLIRYLKRS
ncbi:MAG: four helix bundle protein [Deltaproteobacteria bacterium]|nr:MAG: four helix bundle protein [Deltaproteobacteria bacterium]